MNPQKEFNGIEIPESIQDTEMIEYVEVVEKLINIAVKHDLPLMFLTVTKENKSIIAGQGCTNCLIKLLTEILIKEPYLVEKMILPAIANSMMYRFEDQQIVNHAKKNDPTGN